MASLLAPAALLNFQSLASSSGRRGSTAQGGSRAKSVSASLRGTAAARDEVAMMASISALPVGGRSFALAHAAKLRLQFPSSSSSSCSVLRCNAVQDDQQQQEDSGNSSSGADSNRKGAATAAVPEEGNKPALERLREDLRTRRQNFWHDFKEQHVVYKHDREKWGLGLNPIFTVHEDAEGNRYQVDVNESEILLRSGVDPNMTQFADEECKSLAERRIEMAKDHAKDIQLGLVNPSRLSIAYVYEREGSSSTSSVGDGSWPGGSSSDAPSIAPWQLLLLVSLSVVSLGLGVKWLFSRKKVEEDPVVYEKKQRQMQARKLKAQMSRELSEETLMDKDRPAPHENGDSRASSLREEPEEVFGEIVEADPDQLPGNDAEFQRKITEIRAMARKARLQEQASAEARSAYGVERQRLLEQERKKERIRVQGLESLAKDLDSVRRLGADTSDGPDFIANAVKVSEEQIKIPKVEENRPPPTSLNGGASGDNPPGTQPGAVSPSPSRSKSNSPAQKSARVKPRIILSAEEARARIAAKRARLSASSSSSAVKSEAGSVTQSIIDSGTFKRPTMETPSSTNAPEFGGLKNTASLAAQETPTVLPDTTLEGAAESASPAASEALNSVPVEKTKRVESDSMNAEKQIGERTRDGAREDKGRGSRPRKSQDEEEEMEWMRDDVLREIVFKVQANEEAGREPFHNLNSEQETLFFRGLERKFEREGDEVKKWIKDRVENIDYGSDGISVYDTPDSYELKWKEGVDKSPKSQKRKESADKSPKSEFYSRFSEDRERIMNEKKGLAYTSPPDTGQTSATNSEERSSSLSSSNPSPTSSTAPSSPTSPPMSKNSETLQGKSRETVSGVSKTKSVISSSPRIGKGIIPSPATTRSPEAGESEAGKENWDHTKRWAKDLERKYAMEKDPATKALMREIGQDLERWITEDEIEAASRMLDNGVEGEEEYVKIHYNRTMEKLKKQQDMFGRDAVLNKYSEYKEEVEEPELWWLSLPFVVCIGLRARVEGEQQTGLYSVDVSAALEDVPDSPSVLYHTVAFQDRGDAKNFCTLINSQPEKLGAEGAEVVPFDPKELYKDAKFEGFKVTVIKKGQLQLTVDKPFEEVESRIVELGSARYFDELLGDRVIDMQSVVDEGLGFGR